MMVIGGEWVPWVFHVVLKVGLQNEGWRQIQTPCFWALTYQPSVIREEIPGGLEGATRKSPSKVC